MYRYVAMIKTQFSKLADIYNRTLSTNCGRVFLGVLLVKIGITFSIAPEICTHWFIPFIKVLNELSQGFIFFYINFRGRDISTSGDFLNSLFRVDWKRRRWLSLKSPSDDKKDFLKEFLKGGTEIIRRYSGIPITGQLR